MSSGGHSLSFVLLPTSQMPSLDEFRSTWGDVARGAAAPNVRAWDSESAELDVDGVTTIVSLMPFPVPKQEAEAAAARSLSAMRSGGFSPAPHVAHLMIASTSPTHSHVERLLRHTRVVAALTKVSRAIGVYEGNASATHEPSFYVNVAANGPQPPLMLWNGVSIAKGAETTEVLTLGMGQLELPDLLLVVPSGQGNEGLAFVFDLLSYVISRGSAIPEGETVGRTAEEKLPVSYVPSPVDPATRVMKVELPRAKKRWWPFGAN